MSVGSIPRVIWKTAEEKALVNARLSRSRSMSVIKRTKLSFEGRTPWSKKLATTERSSWPYSASVESKIR